MKGALRGRRLVTLLTKCCQEIGEPGSKAGLHDSFHVPECSRKAVGTKLNVNLLANIFHRRWTLRLLLTHFFIILSESDISHGVEF